MWWFAKVGGGFVRVGVQWGGGVYSGCVFRGVFSVGWIQVGEGVGSVVFRGVYSGGCIQWGGFRWGRDLFPHNSLDKCKISCKILHDARNKNKVD